MSNPIETIGHDLKVAGVDVVRGVEYVGRVATDIVRVLSDARELSPAFKQEIATLVNDIEPMAVALGPAVASEGENIALDIAAVEPVLGAIKKVVVDFTNFLPTLRQAISAIKADVQ